jgi:hypothetical protein
MIFPTRIDEAFGTSEELFVHRHSLKLTLKKEKVNVSANVFDKAMSREGV